MHTPSSESSSSFGAGAGLSPAAADALRRQVAGLRQLLVAMLVGLIVLSLGVGLFMARQLRSLKIQYSDQLPLVTKMKQEFALKEPVVQRFIAALHAYGATNRNVQTLVEKYRAPLDRYYPPAQPAPMVPASMPSTLQK